MIEIHTPCRLHFGLLAYGQQKSRQFGGVGLMVRRPRIVVRVRQADEFTATGPLAERAVEIAGTFAANWARRFGAAAATNARGPLPIHGATIEILEAPRAHTGLGTGTQLAMALAKALAELAGGSDASNLGVEDLAALTGRGQRSAIGAYGFFHGGLIVEGGKHNPAALAPLLVQQSFPPHWRILLITPLQLAGVSGDRERQAFAKMKPIPRDVTAEMCRLVLLGMLPALIERDIDGFGQSLYELQQRVGQCFASAQGGVFAHPMLEEITRFIRARGVQGVGQSSWGPTLYAVVADEATGQALAAEVARRFGLGEGELLVTAADNEGCQVIDTTSAARKRS